MKKLVLLSAALMVAFTVSSQNGRRSADHKVQREVVSSRSSRGSEVKKEHKDNRRGDKYYKKDSNSRYTKGNKPVIIKDTRHPKYHANRSDFDRFYSSKHHYSTKHYKKHQDIHYIDRRHNHRAIAVRVNVIPHHHHRFVFNGLTFYYTAGAFYRYHHNYYELVTPPVGAVVYELPYDADRVSIDGRIYYEFHDTIYKKIETDRGYAYEVVGQLDWN